MQSLKTCGQAIAGLIVWAIIIGVGIAVYQNASAEPGLSEPALQVTARASAPTVARTPTFTRDQVEAIEAAAVIIPGVESAAVFQGSKAFEDAEPHEVRIVVLVDRPTNRVEARGYLAEVARLAMFLGPEGNSEPALVPGRYTYHLFAVLNSTGYPTVAKGVKGRGNAHILWTD